MTDANGGVAAIHVDQDDIVRICGKTMEELQELLFAEEPEWLPCIRKITQGTKDCDNCEIGEHPAFACYQISGSVPVGEVP